MFVNVEELTPGVETSNDQSKWLFFIELDSTTSSIDITRSPIC